MGVKIAEEICERLRFSNHDTAQVLALVDNHMRFGHATRMKESTLKKFLRLPGFDEHLALHRADSLASHGNLSTYEFIREKLAEIPPEKIRPVGVGYRRRLDCCGLCARAQVPRDSRSAWKTRSSRDDCVSHDAALEFVQARISGLSAG